MAIRATDSAFDGCDGPEGTETFTGCVVETHVRETAVMSDVYDDIQWATYWDGETFHTRPMYGAVATVDATPEVQARWSGVQAARAWRQAERNYESQEAQNDFVAKGSFARVVKGRKAPIGAIGYVFWESGPNAYSTYKLGLATTEGDTHWPTNSSLVRLRSEEILKDRNCVLVRFSRDGRYGCAVRSGQGKDTRWAVTITASVKDAVACLPTGHLMALAVERLGLS